MRIGEMLVSAGLLTVEQTEFILRRQQSHPEPFGLLAQRMYGLDPQRIENIWTETTIRLGEIVRPTDSEIDLNVLDLVTRRQAWQFRFLPMRMESDGSLLAATTEQHLSRAVRFATRVLDRPCRFVLTDAHYLAGRLDDYYALPGLDERVVAAELQPQDLLQFGDDAA
ncbi:MAG: hypothetical protein MK082_10730 [Phycisphaerales bacterium]|nr:hypothetical protein [Phycisphaerales bacterium]